MFLKCSHNCVTFRCMDDKLTRDDVEICLSLALTSGRALARSQAAEVTAKVVAERLAAELDRSGFVIMRKPIPVGHPGVHAELRHTRMSK